MRCGDFRQTYAEDMAIFESPLPRGAPRRPARRRCSALPRSSRPPTGSTSLNRIFIAIIAATGLNILTGFTGQISLGNAAFLAVGAYSTAVLAGTARAPLPGGDPARRARSPRWSGMVFGVPSLRLKGLYLAVATLAAHFVIEFTASPLGARDRRRERHLHPGGEARPARARRTTGSSST